jgi:hypothetical protein
MVDEPAAREIAQTNLSSYDVVLGAGRELEQGWFFPCVMKGPDAFAGVIVDKQDGRALTVVTGTPMATNPALYDRGYRFGSYDLVVLAFDDLEQTVRLLHDMHPGIVDTYFKFGRVYRVGRGMTEDEIRDRLQQLPGIFSGAFTYHLDRLEEAREAGWLTFEIFEYRPKE